MKGLICRRGWSGIRQVSSTRRVRPGHNQRGAAVRKVRSGVKRFGAGSLRKGKGGKRPVSRERMADALIVSMGQFIN